MKSKHKTIILLTVFFLVVLVLVSFWQRMQLSKSPDSEKPLLLKQEVIDVKKQIQDQKPPSTIKPANPIVKEPVTTKGIKNALDSLPSPPAPGIDLPEPMLDFKISVMLLYNSQDNFYRDRVPYEQIATATLSMLKSRFGNLSRDSVAELLNYARTQQKEYWAAGHLNSSDAYKKCYAAQAAIELAITISPENPMLYEELAEIICAAHPLTEVAFQKETPRTVNRAIVTQLIDIRTKQLSLYQNSDDSLSRSEEGINPVFKATIELVYLHESLNDNGTAIQVLEQAIQLANKGNWKDRIPILESYKQELLTDSKRTTLQQIQIIALNQRFGDLKRGGAKKVLYETLSVYFRRGPLFEGPLYIERLAKN